MMLPEHPNEKGSSLVLAVCMVRDAIEEIDLAMKSVYKATAQIPSNYSKGLK